MRNELLSVLIFLGVLYGGILFIIECTDKGKQQTQQCIDDGISERICRLKKGE